MITKSAEELELDHQDYLKLYDQGVITKEELLQNNSSTQINFIPQGWQCPICKVIHSPNILSCPNCQPQIQQPYTPPELVPPYYPSYPDYPFNPSFTCIIRNPNDLPPHS